MLKKSEKGMTLLEVILSFTFFVVVSMATLSLFSSSLVAVDASKYQATADFYVQRLVDEFILSDRAARVSLPRTNLDGVFSFERVVRTHHTGLLQLEVTVFWGHGRVQRNLRVVTLVAQN